MHKLTRLSLSFSLIASIASIASAEDSPIKVGATLELNYTYNANSPAAGAVPTGLYGGNGSYFNKKSGEVALNYGELHFYKDKTAKEPGFSIRFVDGEVKPGLPVNAANYNTSTGNLYEAVISQQLTSKLAVDAGIFPTWVGYETIPMGTGNFFTKSFHFGQFQPFYHGGVKANITLSEKTTLVGAIVNRFSGVETNGNKDLGLGFQLAHVLSDKSTVYVNGLSSRDTLQTGTVAGAAVFGEKQRNIANVVYTRKLSAAANIALDASLTTGKDATNATYNGQAFTGYYTQTLANGNTVGLRAETLSADGNTPWLALGGSGKPQLSSVTASYELKSSQKGVRTLIEARFDSANTAIFPTKSAPKKNQTTISLAHVLSF
ncbi:MAG: outer membrane beta-barrel protein [Armatimonadetes bacterium]|nr:outer membrane beta-barrel protein [Armatimonadota bacterium]